MSTLNFHLEKLVRDNVARLKPYSSARDEFKDFHEDMVFLDANENTTKSYACFLAKIPKDYLGVNKVMFEGDSLVIVEREKEMPLEIKISTGGLMF